jgi:hypothetical protein
MLIQLDPAERQQVRDQPPHPIRLSRHDVQEAVAGRDIVARVSLERLDEAAQRRQRRAQFMAGVGQEIDAHHLGAPRVGFVTQDDQGERALPFSFSVA